MNIFSRTYPFYKYVFAVSDWLLIAFAALLANAAMDHAGWLDIPLGEVFLVLVSSLGAPWVFHYLNLYKLNVIVTVADHTLRLVLGALIVVAGFSLAAFIGFPDVLFSQKLSLLYFGGLLILFMVFIRVIVLRNVCMLLAQYKLLRRNALIVGGGETGRKLAVTLFLNKHVGLDVVGFVDDEVPTGTAIFRGARVLGSLTSLEEIVSAKDVREILLCVENMEHSRFVELIERCAKTSADVKISSPLYDVIPSRLFIERYGSLPVVTVSRTTPTFIDATSKRVFDIVLASIGIVLLLPLLLFIALAIKLDSPGPILYRQTRVGRNGQPFIFYKFRSMLVGSDNDENRKKLITQMIKSGEAVELAHKGTTKIVNKSRITRVGAILRKTSLDELPQLFNVLKGEMSLVGPRPCLPYEWENYEEWHKKRLSVSPGCTGVWQVSGRSEVGFRDMVILDLYYIQNASLHMDLKLLFKTIPVMLFGKGGG